MSRGVTVWLTALLAAGAVLAGEVAVDKAARAVRVPAVAAKQNTYKVLKGAIEYILVTSGGKEYESLFVTPCPPAAIDAALRKLGLVPGKPAEDGQPPTGAPLRIVIAYEQDGRTVSRAAGEFVLYTKTGKALAAAEWPYTGSTKGFDPQADKEVLQAVLTKSIIGLHLTDASPLIQNARPEAKDANIYKANAAALPPAGTAVTVVLQQATRKVVAGTKRVHVFLSGRVQGVGFRAFTQGAARRLKVVGFVRNLADGRVEMVAEGPEADVDTLVARVRRGPRSARVEKVDLTPGTPTGEFTKFDIRY
jgi:acylphosphatase